MPSAASSVPVVMVSRACSSGSASAADAVPHVVERVAAEPHDGRATSRPASRPARRPRRRARRADHPGDEADALGLGGADPAAGHHQLERLLRRHRADERHRDHERPQPDVDLGRAELGVVGGHHEVAGQGQARSRRRGRSRAPGRSSACRAYHRSANRRGQLAAAVVQLEVAGAVGHAARSAPAQKAWSPAPVEHDHPGLGIGLDLGQAGRSSLSTAHDRALRRSGRLIVSRATPSATLVEELVDMPAP